MVTGLLHDFRYALRQLGKKPGFAAVVVITLALGIGANTVAFSVIDAVLLRPLPFYQPERLIEAQSVNAHNQQPNAVCYPDFLDWRAQNETLDHLVSYHDSLFTLTGLERPIQVDAEIVSWDLLPALGIRPELGRGFTPDEEKAASRVVLLSHALWASQFALDPASIGRGVRMALGAQRSTVLTMVLRDAAVLLATGIAIGTAAALASASVLQSVLYGTGSRNPVVLIQVCIVVALAGLLAAYVPAFRAARVDPMVALRYE